MPTILFTGFPGFLGTELLARVMKRQPREVGATCLVQAKYLEQARQRVAALVAQHPELAGRIELCAGDITKPNLGFMGLEELALQTVEIFHLAALYDLSAPRDLAMRINVDGTHHMLEFAVACPKLRRFHHMSTCYVSGSYPGAFTERDLQRGQRFNNHYEETKYLAELEVQRRMREGLPVTIYRPAIVMGNSATGETQKYDGPYFILQWVMRQWQYALVPMVGQPDQIRVNVVPSDFVVEAVSYLSGLERSVNKVYQLCDAQPLTVREMLDALGRATGKNVVKLPLPAWLARNAIAHAPGLKRLTGIPAEAIDYFCQPTYYTCDNTLADLEGSGIRCPRFGEYAPRLADFMKQHPEIGSAAMA